MVYLAILGASEQRVTQTDGLHTQKHAGEVSAKKRKKLAGTGVVTRADKGRVFGPANVCARHAD